jgi:hypothetical protein
MLVFHEMRKKKKKHTGEVVYVRPSISALNLLNGFQWILAPGFLTRSCSAVLILVYRWFNMISTKSNSINFLKMIHNKNGT